MASFLSFIKQYINTKDTPLDKQLEELAGVLGASGDGALTAQSYGTWITEKGNTFIAPENGVYRIVAVSKGGSGYKSEYTGQFAGGGTGLIVARLKQNDSVCIDENNIVKCGSDNICKLYDADLCTPGRAETYDIDGVVLAHKSYNGNSDGSVGVYIPGLMTIVEDYKNSDRTYGNWVTEVGGSGFTNKRTPYVVSAYSTYDAISGAFGYGGGAASRYFYGGNRYQIMWSESLPPATIITLLKKE